MDSARDRPEEFARLVAEAPFDLSTEIAAVNARRRLIVRARPPARCDLFVPGCTGGGLAVG